MKDTNVFADFTAPQRAALLDLLVLAMYVDGHLATVEDVRLRRILDMMGFTTHFDRNRELDASVTRIRPHVEHRETAQRHARQLAERFGTVDERRVVASVLEEFMRCDSDVTPDESTLLAMVKQLFSL